MLRRARGGDYLPEGELDEPSFEIVLKEINEYETGTGRRRLLQPGVGRPRGPALERAQALASGSFRGSWIVSMVG